MFKVKEAEVERKTILNMIKEAKSNCFSNLISASHYKSDPIVNVFGSMQTGIAIDSSDMDVLISGQFGTTRQDLLDNMKVLLDELLKVKSVDSS